MSKQNPLTPEDALLLVQRRDHLMRVIQEGRLAQKELEDVNSQIYDDMARRLSSPVASHSPSKITRAIHPTISV